MERTLIVDFVIDYCSTIQFIHLDFYANYLEGEASCGRSLRSSYWITEGEGTWSSQIYLLQRRSHLGVLTIVVNSILTKQSAWMQLFLATRTHWSHFVFFLMFQPGDTQRVPKLTDDDSHCSIARMEISSHDMLEVIFHQSLKICNQWWLYFLKILDQFGSIISHDWSLSHTNYLFRKLSCNSY